MSHPWLGTCLFASLQGTRDPVRPYPRSRKKALLIQGFGGYLHSVINKVLHFPDKKKTRKKCFDRPTLITPCSRNIQKDIFSTCSLHRIPVSQKISSFLNGGMIVLENHHFLASARIPDSGNGCLKPLGFRNLGFSGCLGTAYSHEMPKYHRTGNLLIAKEICSFTMGVYQLPP